MPSTQHPWPELRSQAQSLGKMYSSSPEPAGSCRGRTQPCHPLTDGSP